MLWTWVGIAWKLDCLGLHTFIARNIVFTYKTNTQKYYSMLNLLYEMILNVIAPLSRPIVFNTKFKYWISNLFKAIKSLLNPKEIKWNLDAYVGLLLATTARGSDEDNDTSSRPQTAIARAITCKRRVRVNSSFTTRQFFRVTLWDACFKYTHH